MGGRRGRPEGLPFVPELLQALQKHEITWIVRLNGFGWDRGSYPKHNTYYAWKRGERTYGTQYTVVHDAGSGSGM